MFPIQPEQISKYVVEASNEGVWIIDAEMQTQFVNRRLAEMLGCTVEEMKDTNLVEFVFEVDKTKILQKIERQKPEIREEFDFRFRRKDGSAIWARVSTSPIYDKDGKFIGTLGMLTDITPHKQAEDAINARENQLRLITDSLPALIAYVDAQHFYRFANETYKEWFGLEPGEIIGKHIGEILGKAAYKAILPEMKRTLAGEELTFERLLPYRDGGARFVQVNYIPDIDDKGNVQGYFSLVLDISERKEAEKNLGKIEERYRAFIEQSSEGIWRFELEKPIPVNLPTDKQIRLAYKYGYLAECNDAMARQYGFDSAKDIIGARLGDLLVETDEKNYQFLRAFIESGYRLTEAESHEKDSQGNDLYFLNNFVGFVENGQLLRAWGTQREITERKKIGETASYLAAIVESSDDAIISKDLNGIITSWNKSAEKIFGYLPQEIIGKSITTLIPPERANEETTILGRIRKGERMEHYETVRRRKDGNYIDISLTVSPIRDESGRIIGASKIARDITERKRTEEISERYRLLSMYARDVILFLRSDGKIIEANQAAIETYGYDYQTLLQMNIRDLRSNETLRLLDEQLSEAAVGSVQFETAHRRKDGSLLPVEVSSTGIEIGGERMLISIIRDITERRKTESERKRAQEALIKAERKAAEEYQILLERIVPLGQTLGTARDLISIYRAILEFVSTSMSCSAFFVSFYDARNKQRTAAYAWGEGREVDISELPPMPLSEDGGPNSQAVFQKKVIIVNRYWDFMKTRPHVILQENGINPMSSLVVPMMIKNEVIGTLEVQAHENEAFSQEQAVALEMAANLAAVAIENVRLLEVEAEARRIAEDANRAKDEFLSVLSHELRTPLNSMLGWVRMLQAGMLDEQRTKQAIEVIERNTRLQNSLIEDLLDVSRIISGKMRIEKEEVDLTAVATNSCETLRPVAEEKNILFECSCEDEPLMLEGDAVRLHQIISNLVQNAIKFTSEGEISVTLKKVGDWAQLIVKDTGIGIESDVLPHIFERFKQADASTRRTHSGLGLGLTIVSNLVELHGGSVEAESGGKGQGSTFIVELPIAEKYLHKEDEAGNETLAGGNNSSLKGARILLVDDDADSIIPLQMLLEREKAEVIKVFSADEALAKLMEQPFHILVSDIGMPEMDGYDLIAKIRKLTSEQNAFLPAIALTAYAAGEDRRRALSAGFQMHFSKPFDFDELLSAIIQLYKGSK